MDHSEISRWAALSTKERNDERRAETHSFYAFRRRQEQIVENTKKAKKKRRKTAAAPPPPKKDIAKTIKGVRDRIKQLEKERPSGGMEAPAVTRLKQTVKKLETQLQEEQEAQRLKEALSFLLDCLNPDCVFWQWHEYERRMRRPPTAHMHHPRHSDLVHPDVAPIEIKRGPRRPISAPKWRDPDGPQHREYGPIRGKLNIQARERKVARPGLEDTL